MRKLNHKGNETTPCQLPVFAHQKYIISCTHVCINIDQRINTCHLPKTTLSSDMLSFLLFLLIV